MTTAPTAESERAEVLDALRGFALLGILVSHAPGFSGLEFLPPPARDALDVFGIDHALAVLSEFLVRGKFFSLFSLLFGIGFAIQLEAAQRRGARFARHFARRLAVLGAIGVLHGLVWYGDILRDYALLGLALIPTATLDARKTLRIALVLIGGRIAWPLLVLAIAPWLAPVAGATAPGDPQAHFGQLTRAFATGGAAEVFAANLDLLRLKALQLVYEGKALSILGMFFLGAALGKARLHRALSENRALLVRTLSWSAPIGLVGNGLLVPLHAATPAYPPTQAWALEGVLFAVAVPAASVAYACAFALCFTRGARVLRAFAPAGRVALTTYVSQTLVCIAVFYGVGLGLAGSFGRLACVAFAFALFAAQSVLASAWLRRFEFGPLEWCWRRLTYGVPIRMRRVANAR